MWKRLQRWLVTCLALVAVLAAACGRSEARGDRVASIDEGQGTARGGQEAKGRQRAEDSEQAMLAFARCMREHGVDMPDPKPGERGLRFEAPAGGGGLPDESSFQEAEKACRHLAGDAGPAGPDQLSPGDRKAVQDAMLAFARCMREQGIDMPDPQPGGGGILMKRPEGAGNTSDPRSPEFEAAEKECRKHTEAMDKKLGVTRSEG